MALLLERLNNRIERIENHFGLGSQEASSASRETDTSAPVSETNIPLGPPHVPPPANSIPPPPIIPPQSSRPVPISRPDPAPLPVSVPVEADKASVSLEELIGGKWSIWVGSMLVFLAVAYGLNWAWRYLPSSGRLAIAFGVGVAFLLAGRISRNKLDDWFSEALTGAGLAVAYLSVWAGAQTYHLIRYENAFALMAAITALGAVLAISYDAASLIALATIGGFLTPVLLHAGGDHGTAETYPLLIYIAFLDAGILGVSLFKRWRGVVLLSFAATVLLMLAWTLGSYTPAMRLPVLGFLTVYFLFFFGASCFYSLLRKEQTKDLDLLLLFSTATVYFMAGQVVWSDARGCWVGAFPLCLAAFFALAAWITRLQVPDNFALSRSLSGLAVLFLTLYIPIQLRHGWIPVGWSIEAAVLLLLGHQLNSSLLRRAAQFVWMISLVGVIMAAGLEEVHRQVMLINERSFPMLAAVLSNMGMGLWSRYKANHQNDELTHCYLPAAALGGAWIIVQETTFWFMWRQNVWQSDWQTRVAFSTACLLAVYGLLIYFVGLRLRYVPLRAAAGLMLVMASLLPVMTALAVPPSGWKPFWNLRWLSYVINACSLGALTWLMSREKAENLCSLDKGAFAVLPVALSMLALMGLSIEVFAGFRWMQAPSPASWTQAAVFALCMLWASVAALLLSWGLAWQNPPLRTLAYVIGALSVVALMFNALTCGSLFWSPWYNWRFAGFMTLIVVQGLVAQQIRAKQSQIAVGEKGLGATAGFTAVCLLLWALTQETYETTRFYRKELGPSWELAAQMCISLVWTLYGVILLLVGIVRKYQPIRLFALGLMGLTVFKVVLIDLAFLSTQYRVFSFGGLGIALIGISWLYSRYGVGRAKQ